MKLIDLDCRTVEFRNGDESFKFINLKGLCDANDSGNCWKLCEYSKIANGKFYLKMAIKSLFNQNGSYSLLNLKYTTNDLINRTLQFSEKGNLQSDKISFSNPLKDGDVTDFHAIVLKDISLDDYFDEYSEDESRVFRNQIGDIFRNSILPDSIIKDFLDKNESYGRVFNSCGDNLGRMFDIIENDELDSCAKQTVDSSKKVLSIRK